MIVHYCRQLSMHHHFDMQSSGSQFWKSVLTSGSQFWVTISSPMLMLSTSITCCCAHSLVISWCARQSIPLSRSSGYQQVEDWGPCKICDLMESANSNASSTDAIHARPSHVLDATLLMGFLGIRGSPVQPAWLHGCELVMLNRCILCMHASSVLRFLLQTSSPPHRVFADSVGQVVHTFRRAADSRSHGLTMQYWGYNFSMVVGCQGAGQGPQQTSKPQCVHETHAHDSLLTGMATQGLLLHNAHFGSNADLHTRIYFAPILSRSTSTH